jgi:tetratricopeptide (TPR) repeat protein
MKSLLLAGVCCLAVCWTDAAGADQPLNPKDALAPIFRENPKLDDPMADLSRARNEGIAHYEGGLTLDRAIAAFQHAYDIGRQPADAFNMALVYMRQNKTADARPWVMKSLENNDDFAAGHYLLGLIEKLDGHADAAKAQYLRANELNPADATLHYELAMLASAEKDQHTFLQELLRALELDPEHKSSLYQMYRYYQLAGNKELAAGTLKHFNAVKAEEKFSRKDQHFDSSSFTRPLRDDRLHDKAGFPFFDSAFGFDVVRPEAGCPLTRLMPMTIIAAPAHEEMLGTCADGTIVRIADGKATIVGKLDAPADDVRVEWLDPKGPRVLAAGPGGVRLSTPIGGDAPMAFDAIDDQPAHRLLLADFEHDGSLDILTDAAAAPLAKAEGKYKRQGGVWATSDLGHALQGNVPARTADLKRRGMADLVTAAGGDVLTIMAGADGYHDGARLHVSDGDVTQVELADLDNAGALAVIAASKDGISIHWGARADDVTRLPADGPGPVRFAVADFNNDGRRDILLINGAGAASLFVNMGPHSFEKRALAAVPAPASVPFVLDENRDGRDDIAYLDAAGAPVVLRNTTKNAGKSFDVLLNGKRAPVTGVLTQVELRKGHLYSYAQSNGGLVHFGLGHEDYAEIVRLEWPNGFVENKIKVDAQPEPYVYLESERIAGSCPTIFVKGRDGFHYVTDAMITTAIGILAQRNTYFGFGDEEHVVIPPGLLAPADGKLDIRITEELRETTYIEHAALLAIDHPIGARLGSTERLAPPTGEKAPWYVARRLVPAARATFEGRDITADLAQLDQRYADTAHRTRNPGFAAPSEIDLTLGGDVDPARVDAVYATGWFQAFDSTAVIGTFKGEAPDFRFPDLQEKVDGAWRSVGFIGLPTGQDRTLVMTLPKGLQSRELRLVSNFTVYWDEIAFSVAGQAPSKVTELPLLDAQERFHGFSHIVSHDPEVFDYEHPEFGMMWSPMPGRFTNYGPVKALIEKKQGNFAVIGGGDEIALTFKAAPPPAPGTARSYILVLDGHVKDADRYTKLSDAVEPMPTLKMTEYPPNDGARESALSARLRQRRGLDYTIGAVSGGKEHLHD